ncbi:MAG: hypothetical protein QOE90_3251 [Thermoplasmata archaeon]|nr:hypothetical protein [Thermoplasmata archaeon]
MPIPAPLVLPAWVTFWVVWLAGAFGNARTVRSAPGWDRLLLALAVVLGILAWRGGLVGPPLRSATIDEPPLLEALGVALLYAGVAFAVWARVTLGRFWSGMVTLKEGHQLVRHGPYAIVRNPIYTGILAMAFGSVLVLGELSVLLWALALLVTFLFKIRAEEKLLREAFGVEFDAYRRDVKSLVPYVY